ncbi:hypothetical protein GCM10027446_23110 [Angustibacter peucedani]
MSRSSDLARVPSADAVLTGTVVLLLGLAVDVFAVWHGARTPDAEGTPTVLAIGSVLALLGVATLGLGLFRLAQKVDDTHRLAVERAEATGT